jgi:hypothetical protein
MFHDQQPGNTPTPNDPDSNNKYISLSPEEETSPSLIRKEIAISSSPSTSPYLIGHDDGTPPPRADPTENAQDSRTPATSNKQIKAAHNECNQDRITQQSNRTTQDSEDDIDIDEIATRTKGSTQTDEQHRSQTGSRKRSTNSSHGNTIADKEEDSIAPRNKGRRKRNKTRGKLLTCQRQDGQVY